MENYNKMDQPGVAFVKRELSIKVLIFALIIIGIGVLLLLQNLGLLNDHMKEIIFSWPSIVILIALLNIGGKKTWFGVLLFIFGGFFMTAEILSLPFDLKMMFWPLLIIFIGIAVVFFSFSKRTRKHFSKSTINQNRIEELNILGGGDRVINTDHFEGGEIVNIFGGSKLDFRKSKLTEGSHVLEFINIFGGSTLIFPPDWNIIVEVISIFGGISDKRMRGTTDPSKTLILKGVAIFGGGEIKNDD